MPPRRSGRNANAVVADKGATKQIKDEETDENESTEPSNSAIKATKAVIAKKAVTVTKKTTTVKRKLKDEGEEEEDEEGITEKKVTKKRKTKEEKDAETMPLVDRTLVSTLKKAVHIGAHVSAAGGTYV